MKNPGISRNVFLAMAGSYAATTMLVACNAGGSSAPTPPVANPNIPTPSPVPSGTGVPAAVALSTSTPFILMSNSSDPLLAQMLLSDGQTVDIFGNRDAEGTPVMVSRLLFRNDDVENLTIVLDETHRPINYFTKSGVQFSFEWQSATVAAITARSANGKFQINTSADISKPAATMQAMQQVNRRNAASVPTDPSARGGVRPKLVFTPANSQPARRTVKSETTGGAPVTVNVQSCGNSNTSNYEVYVVARHSFGSIENLYLGHFPATPTGSGSYVATIPAGTAPSINAAKVCETLTSVLGQGCEILEAYPSSVEDLCLAIGVALTIATDGAAAAAAPEITEACAAAAVNYELYCKTLDQHLHNSNGDEGPAIVDTLICGIPALDRTFTQDITLTAYTPGVPNDIASATVTAPGNGPYPALQLIIDFAPAARSLTLNPAAPPAHEAYVATAKTACLAGGTVVTLSIVGTDGYENSEDHAVDGNQGDGTYTLDVPGAATSGIQDTVTLTIKPQTGDPVLLTASLVFQ